MTPGSRLASVSFDESVDDCRDFVGEPRTPKRIRCTGEEAEFMWPTGILLSELLDRIDVSRLSNPAAKAPFPDSVVGLKSAIPMHKPKP